MHRLLLCQPDYYGIEYEINPWMSRARNADPLLARRQWLGLRDLLRSLGCDIDLIEPQPGVPDMVFTANAGLAVGRNFIRSNYRHKERRGEAPFFEDWFAQHGCETVRLPGELVFEGEGDALFAGDTLFCGYQFRSDIKSHQWLGEFLNCLVISVQLVDSRFYHLDTCFCPLAENLAMWYPPAFDEYGQKAIRQHVGDLVEIASEEALRFGCNAVVIGRRVVLSEGCPKICAALSERGYECHPLPMSEFMKAGGACKCLTLFVPQH